MIYYDIRILNIIFLKLTDFSNVLVFYLHFYSLRTFYLTSLYVLL